MTKEIFRSTKLEFWTPSSENVSSVRIVVDFGENIQLIEKHETAVQFFHRKEVL